MYVTMQITFNIPEFMHNERNLHCDVVHITTVRVARLVLDDAIAAIQTSPGMSDLANITISPNSSIFSGCIKFHGSFPGPLWTAAHVCLDVSKQNVNLYWYGRLVGHQPLVV